MDWMMQRAKPIRNLEYAPSALSSATHRWAKSSCSSAPWPTGTENLSFDTSLLFFLRVPVASVNRAPSACTVPCSTEMLFVTVSRPLSISRRSCATSERTSSGSSSSDERFGVAEQSLAGVVHFLGLRRALTR